MNHRVQMRISCLAAAIASGLLAGCLRESGPSAAPVLRLTEGGKPAAAIVLDAAAGRAARLAAAELRHHVERISGAALPVVTNAEAAGRGVRILVGDSAAVRALRLGGGALGPREYRICYRPGALVLMGRDAADAGPMDYTDPETWPGRFEEQATLHAVYDFLERDCGVRWYLPTELGGVCPEAATLEVSGADVRRAPSMAYRELSRAGMLPADLSDEPGPAVGARERALYERRQRLTGVEPYASNHAFYHYYWRHLKAHPEWFAKGYDGEMPAELRDPKTPFKADFGKGGGGSYSPDGYPVKYYPNMCYTDAGFISNVIRRANAYFATGEAESGEAAAGDYFSLGPMDSSGSDKFCLCAACRAAWEPTHRAPPCAAWRKQHFFFDDKASDYLYGFVNRVARAVGREHPGKYVTTLAYHQTYYPPTREALEPNVAITLCQYALFRAVPAMDRAALELMDRWDAESRDRRKSLWLWFCYPNRVDAKTFPPFMAHKLVRDMADYHRRGIRGLFAEPASLPPVLDEAGRRVRETATRAPNVNLLELYVTYKLAYDAALDGDALIDEFFRLYYGAAGPAMQALYEAIEAVYTDPANYAFNPTGYFGFQTPEIAWGRLGTAERIAEFGGRMAAARAAAQTDLERRRVALFEQNIWERMVAGRQAYEEQEARRVPVALTGLSPADCMKPVEPGSEGRPEVPTPLKSAVAARIKGDSPGGDPGRVDWTQAPPGACLLNWGTLDGQPTDRRLEGRLLHDGRFLYLQLQEAMDTSRLVVHGDNNIWAEDDWEIFVARERGSGYRQIGVNANGAYQALTYGETDRKWNLSPAVVSLGNSRCWAVRMALPLERLLPGGVEPGQTVYLNFCRGTGAGLEAVSWNPTFGGFQEPSQLGAIELAP